MRISKEMMSPVQSPFAYCFCFRQVEAVSYEESLVEIL
jgi:hypothetical protein